MSEKSWVMEKLARTLSESERLEFLRQIHASLRDNDYVKNQLVRHEPDENEKKVLLQQDIRKLSPFRYLLLWIKKIFSGKSMTNLYLDMRINQLKKEVRRTAPGIAGFETRTLKAAFPEYIFEVFVKTIPLIGLFRRLWRNESEINFFHQLVFSLIESNLDNQIDSCYELVQIEELIQLYLSGVGKENLVAEIEKNIDSYVDSVDPVKFEIVENQLAPLYGIRDLVLYPFPKLFQNFHGTIRRDDPETLPLFQKTSALTSMDMVEELYYALHHTARSELKQEFNQVFVDKLFDSAYEDEGDHEEEAEGPGIHVDADTDTFLDDVRNLQECARDILKKVHLPQLIRAFKEDPYYRLVVYVPKLDIKDFYRNMKKLSFRDEIEEIIKKVRQESLTKERGRLFEGSKLRALHYYRTYSTIDYVKIGITAFRYYQGILVLFNFLSVYYKGPVQRILQILESFISEQDRLTRERMLKYASAAEDALYKIRELDESLSPEQDDGKKFQRLRFESNIDPVQKRVYLSIIAQKDTEARELLMKGRDSQRGIRLLFKEFLENQDSLIQESLGKKYLLQGKVKPLHEVLHQNIIRIELLEKIELQLDNIRDETGYDEVTI